MWFLARSEVIFIVGIPSTRATSWTRRIRIDLVDLSEKEIQ